MKAIRRAGERDQRVVIQSVTQTADSHGSPTATAATLGTFWASVLIDGAGNEGQQGGQITGSTGYTIEIDYNATTSAITTKHQATWRGKTFNIGAVNIAGIRDGLMRLSCAEVAA